MSLISRAAGYLHLTLTCVRWCTAYVGRFRKIESGPYFWGAVKIGNSLVVKCSAVRLCTERKYQHEKHECAAVPLGNTQHAYSLYIRIGNIGRTENRRL